MECKQSFAPSVETLKYRLVAFDFDGTLADTSEWFLKIFDELADEFGFKRLEPHLHEIARMGHARDLLKLLGVPLWKLPAIMRRTREYSARDADSLSLFPGVAEMLLDLKKCGYVLAVVSSNSEESIKRVLRENANLIDQYHCGSALFGKTRKLKRLLKAAGISSNEALYIGDELRDQTAAMEAGMAFGAVAWGYTAPESLRSQNPDLFFEKVPDIQKALTGRH